MKNLMFLIFAFNVFASEPNLISINDDIVRIPSQYSKLKLSEREAKNKQCMLKFLEDILKDESKEESLFKTLKSSGYSIQMSVDRYGPEKQIKSQSDPRIVRKVEKILKDYAHKKGIKGKDVLTQIFKKITNGEEIEASGQFYDVLTFETSLSFDDLREFTEDFAVRRQNEKIKRERNRTITSLDRGLLKVKIPDLQNLWCKENYQKRIAKELRRQVTQIVLKDISPKMMKYYDKVVKFLNTKFKSPSEKCLAEESLNKLRNRLFKDYKFNERAGWIVDLSGRRVYNENLKSDLYNYFYEKRRGLLEGEDTGSTDHIIPGTMIYYVNRYFGEGDKRKRCLVAIEYRDRLGKLVQERVRKTCVYIKQKMKVEVEASKDCPPGEIFNPEKKKCVKLLFCPIGSVPDFVTGKCKKTKACNDDEMFNPVTAECVEPLECEEGFVINYFKNECVQLKSCENGFFDVISDRCIDAPKLKECPKGQRFNFQLEKCITIKTCGESEYLDQVDKKCYSVKPCNFNELLIQGECKKQSICDEGEIFVSFRNRCEKRKECKRNQLYNPNKNQCEESVFALPEEYNRCDDDEIYNYMSGGCEKACPYGTVRFEGSCRRVKNCPMFYRYDFKNEKCIKVDQDLNIKEIKQWKF